MTVLRSSNGKVYLQSECSWLSLDMLDAVVSINTHKGTEYLQRSVHGCRWTAGCCGENTEL